MIRLLIKGTEAEARKAAEDRGVMLADVRPIYEGANEVFADCLPFDFGGPSMAAVKVWYGATPYRAHFQPGDLLGYSEAL